MFPQKFYISKEQNELVHTTVVTTQVQDAVDLVRRSDPWVKIKENPLKEERQEKKVLIFADKFFSNRSPDNKEAIYGKLKKARRAGFKILIPSRNEGLVEWKGDEIADNFSSEISDFDLEKINTLVLDQHQLPNKKICVLDYFSINEWIYTYNRGKNVILMSDFFGTPELFIRLSEETQSPHYCISAPKPGVLEAISNKINLSQSVEYVAEERHVFLDALGGTIKRESCKRITGFLSDLGGGRCQLKEIDLDRSDEKGQSIAALLRAAPNLEILKLESCKLIAGVFSDLKENSLGQLKEIRLDEADVTASDIRALLRTAPSLEILRLFFCKSIAGVFLDLKENELAHLKEIILSGANVTAKDIATLLRVVPGLERLILRGCKENIINVFYDFKENELAHLKEIDLSWAGVTAEDMKVLLRAAPGIETLTLNNCSNLAGIFLDLKENELAHLKEINLEYSGVTAKDIKRLLNVAPGLEILNLQGCGGVVGAFYALEKNELAQLKEVNLSRSAVTASDIRALLYVATGLKTLKLSFSEIDATSEDIEELLEALPNLSSDTQIELKKLLENSKSQDSRSGTSRGNKQFSNFNTDSPKKTFSCVEYFPGMAPSLYRLKAVRPDLQGLQLNDVTGEGFENYVINPDFKHQKEFAAHYQTHEGYKQVNKVEGSEIILPSLNANEVLTRLTVHDAAGHLIALPKEAIQHSDAVGFYKVILPTAGRFQIQFEVAEPLLMPVLPQSLQKKVNRYQGFKKNELQRSEEHTSEL